MARATPRDAAGTMSARGVARARRAGAGMRTGEGRRASTAGGRCARIGARAVERGRLAGGGDDFRAAPVVAVRAPPLVIARNVRAGEVIEHAGEVLVKGDIERDARVLARGDVYVWGALRGEVEIEGDAAAEVRALDMRPEVLRIGDANMAAPTHLLVADSEDRRPRRATAEVASARNGVIVIRREEGDAALAVRRASIVTGSYISIVGLALLLCPRVVFSILFSAFDISSVWIRVFGVLCVTFGSYYLGAPLFESKGLPYAFYRATVLGRVWVCASLVVVALLERHAQFGLILLGTINAISAFAMHRAIASAER